MDWTKEEKQLETELRDLPTFDLPMNKHQEIFDALQKHSVLTKKRKASMMVTKSAIAAVAVLALAFGLWHGGIPAKLNPLTPGSKSQQSNEPIQSTHSTINYTSEQKASVLQKAQELGIKTVYTPQSGTIDDYLMDVQIERNNQLALIYPHFGIRESTQDLKPLSGVTKEIDIQLKNGPAKWIYVGNSPTLYFKLNETNISINTAKPVTLEQLQTVAESMQPLNEGLFYQGAGGDLQWWGSKGGTNPEERTIIGFMNSFLKGDIGVVSNQPAAMDQYFESKNIDVKKNLYRYDGSSGPIVKQVYYSNMVEDSAGTNYLFKTIGESSIQNETFEVTLSVHLNKTSFKIDDLRVTETKPPLGIIHDFPSYLDSSISNGWRGKINDRYVEFFAGSLNKDPSQGIVIKIDHPSNNLNDRLNTGYFTPTKHGTLKIIKEENLKLTLEAKDGTRFIFDLNTLSFSNS